jgi:F-type H+-transporting ATPase subunit b
MSSKGLPQMDWEYFPTQIFWLAVTFSILYFVVRFFALPRIEGAIALRDRSMDTDLQEAKRLQREADSLLKTYQERFEKAQKEATHILAQSTEDAKKRLAQQEQVLQEALNVKTFQAEQHLHSFKQDVQTRLKDIILDVSKNVIEKLGIGEISIELSVDEVLSQTKH